MPTTKARKPYIRDHFDKKYGGKYVAFRSPGDEVIIAYGSDPLKVSERAAKKSTTPLVVYIAAKGERFLY